MLVTGLALASMTAVGFYLIFCKLPRSVKKFIQKHSLLTDVIACALTYLLFGGTLVALFAAAWLGIIISILLAVVNNPGANKALEGAVATATSYWKKFEEWLAKKYPVTEEDTK